MDNKNLTNEQELAVNALIEDAAQTAETQTSSVPKQVKAKKSGFFQSFKIKDIVFLAVITALTLVTGAIMPLLIHVPVYGIIQLGLGLQFSLFPTIGLMKVRKPGSLILMSLFSGALLVFMFPPMFFCMLICAVIAEILTAIIFRGYQKDMACVFASTLYLPCSLPFLHFYYNVIYTWTNTENEAVSQFVGTEPVTAVLITLAILALCFVGANLGRIIAKELKKAGKLK